MNISQTLDQAANSLDQINWKEASKEAIGTYFFLCQAVVIFCWGTYLAFKAGLWLIHRLNDILAANWVRMLGLSPIPVMEEEENEEDEFPLQTTPSTPSEVEQAPLPGITKEVSVPTPPVVEVELNLPPVAEVVEIPVLDDQPPARRRRSSSAPRSLKETVTEEVELTPPSRKPRGRRAHAQRNRAAA